MNELPVTTLWLTRLSLPRKIRLAADSGLCGARLTTRSASRSVRPTIAGAVLLTSAIAACASTPIAPSPDMVRAEVAIAQAQKAGAGDLANDSLQSAQRKIDEAKAAASKGDARRAQYLVDESMSDAQLADLTAQSVKSAKAAAEIDQSIIAIRSEADRRTPQ